MRGDIVWECVRTRQRCASTPRIIAASIQSQLKSINSKKLKVSVKMSVPISTDGSK